MLNNLLCNNCRQNFNDNIRKPLMLYQCGHTFCRRCIKQGLEQKHFVCPDDKKMIKFESKEIENFPIN